MLGTGPVRQLGYVTGDVEAAAMQWVNAGVAGPFFLMRKAVFQDWSHEDQTAPITLDIAFGQSGDVMVELIAPKDGAVDLYRPEMPKEDACRPHHLGYLVKDLARAGQALGSARKVVRASLDSQNYFEYFDTRPLFGHFTELIEECPETEQFFDLARRAAQEWDQKTNPLRDVSDGA